MTEFVAFPGRPWPDDHPMPMYEVLSLLLAERGDLQYRFDRYRIHGVSNNVLGLVWCGLLTDAPGGPVLTGAGRRRLAAERSAGRLAGYEDGEPAEAPGAASGQLPLFALAALSTTESEAT